MVKGPYQFLFCIFVLLTYLCLHFTFLRVPTNFCSTLFVLHFCSANLCHPMAKGPHQFLFRIFVPLTFLHFHLGSLPPNGQGSLPIFVPHFCSADLFALPLGVPITQWSRVPTNFVPHYCSAHLFALTTLWGVPPPSNTIHNAY